MIKEFLAGLTVKVVLGGLVGAVGGGAIGKIVKTVIVQQYGGNPTVGKIAGAIAGGLSGYGIGWVVGGNTVSGTIGGVGGALIGFFW